MQRGSCDIRFMQRRWQRWNVVVSETGGAKQSFQHRGSGLMQGGGRLLQLFLSGHGDGRGFRRPSRRVPAGPRILPVGSVEALCSLSARVSSEAGFPSAGVSSGTLSAGSSTITLSGVSSGTEAAALGSAVGGMDVGLLRGLAGAGQLVLPAQHSCDKGLWPR